jgi:dynein intermediate chain 1
VAAERAAELEAMNQGGGGDGGGGGGEGAGETKKLRNQFNYSERASQTFNHPLRERPTITEPPPSVGFNGQVNQWEIFDSYVEEVEKQRLTKEKSGQQSTKKAAASGHAHDKEEEEEGLKEVQKEADIVHSTAMSKSLKIMERMVNQNTWDEIAQDYRYWDDQSDSFKEGEGTLLPLWKFWTEKVRRKHVTALCWNPEYHDLFAVGYGSYDFMKQGSGVICCFSLKNPSHPEYSFTTETGVMCLDFHPQHSSLLAVGCYDGTVMIFDIRNKLNKPIFQSTVKSGKHTDPVWQVCWQEEDLAKNLNFFSISSDGRVTLWTMSKNELQYTDVMELKLAGIASSGAEDASGEETSLVGLAGGSCFDFHATSEHLFIVGTEEGRIHKCSKAYNSQYLDSYSGHYMSVYAVRWNKFHPRVFLSASADWTVKLWDHNSKTSLMSFDLGNAVGDISWAPYSSSVFAAVTNDGKVHVFDLAENKHEPMCDQKVVRKSKLTHVAFNPKQPLLLVGDDRGGVLCLKLSPNLRKTEETRAADKAAAAAATGGDQPRKPPPKKRGAEAGADGGAKEEAKVKTPAELEVDKLDKILGLQDKQQR